MSGAPEYKVPYQFELSGHDDTYRMAIDLYLGDVIARVQAGHSLKSILAADMVRSMQYVQDVRKQREELDK